MKPAEVDTDPWGPLSRRVVMVSSYAERDGIGRYAAQLIAARAGGREFVRIGTPEGPGDYPRAFKRGPRALWMLHDAGRGDDLIVHYHPHYYIGGGAPARILSYATWAVVALLRRVTVVLHEPDPAGGPRLEEAVRRWMWRRARRIVFHSEWERERHARRFGRGRRQTHAVVTHGDFFSTSVTEDRAVARDRLGLPHDRPILLMIGFLSPEGPDKGYDRALAALQAAGDPALELHIVGSPIRPGPATEALVGDLRAAAAASPQLVLHEQFVDDETFDRWVRAADAVLTPYRTASSSGVMARAQLLGTPVISSDVGGLREQAGPADTIVCDDEELATAIRAVARARRHPYPPAG